MHDKRLKRNGTLHLHRPVIEPLPGEVWKPVEGSDGNYSVSSLGRVRRDGPQRGMGWPGKEIRGWLNMDGYLVMRPYPRPNRSSEAIHRLVAYAFLGPRPDGREVNHIDGNRRNNAVANLEYITHHENILHSWKLGNVDRKGEANGRAKLNEVQVREIRAAHAAGVPPKVLAARYGLWPSAIHRVVTRKAWSHVP